MFENLTDSMTTFFRKVRLRGNRLTPENIREGLQEVRRALLDADVSFRLVRKFIRDVEVKAVGEEVIRSVAPADQVVKIVHDELIALMGEGDTSINYNPDGPTVIMLAGLQGTGKTTQCAKLAALLKSQGRRPLLVAADIQRPAAIEQLEVLGRQISVPVYREDPTLPGVNPPDICDHALQAAKREGWSVLILDTAGRLAIDEALMQELESVVARVHPQEILLVCDAMTGQDAVNSAKEFNDRLGITGVILTKLDGDARGGAALSVRAVTGKPIKWVGVGEKLDRLEEFHPERMATRILGMGDVVTLVEKTQQLVSQAEAEKLQRKLFRETLTLDDFLQQLQTVKRMGSLKDLLGMIPGFSAIKELEVSEEELKRVEAVIQSMTFEERRNPHLVEASFSRRRRIAAGSGTQPPDVNALIRQFKEVRKQLSSFARAQQFVGRLMPGVRLPGEEQRRHQERKAILQRRKKEKEKRRKGRR